MSLEEFQEIIEAIEIDGNLKSVSLELVSDSPINVSPDAIAEAAPEAAPVASPESTSAEPAAPNPNTDGGTATAQATPSDTSQSPTTDADTTDEPLVSIRKWPRMDKELSVDYELPLSAAAYPSEIVDFEGNHETEVEHNTPYHVQVNGVKDFGVFVTVDNDIHAVNSNPRNDITGLIYQDNLLRKGPMDYSRGNEVVVELIELTEKGLGFREVPLLSVDDAKQARHSELVRLKQLGLDEGDEITFSEWPETDERDGTIIDINWGRDSPPTPPRLTVEGPRTTHEIRPSELVADATTATATVGELAFDSTDDALLVPDSTEQPEPDGTSEPESEVEATVEVDTDQPTSSEETAGSEGTQYNGPTRLPMSASPFTGETDDVLTAVVGSEPEATADIDEEDSDDESDSDDDLHECVCGDTFESKPQMWGHQGQCEEYKAKKAVEEQPDDPDEHTTSDTGRVLNPVVLDITNKYAKVAVALYQVDADALPIREIAEVMNGTDWEMQKANINMHAKTLVDKGAATREKDGVYHYGLTDRGAAGVEKALETMDEEKVPEFKTA